MSFQISPYSVGSSRHYDWIHDVSDRSIMMQQQCDILAAGSRSGQHHDRPYQPPYDALAYMAKKQRGFLGYFAHREGHDEASLHEDLAEITPDNGYLLNLPQAYHDMWKDHYPHMAFEAFLDEMAHQHLSLSPYRNDTEPVHEARYIINQYLQTCGIPSKVGELVIGDNGFKSLYTAAMHGMLAESIHDGGKHTGGRLLAPKGYYSSLIKAAHLLHGDVRPLEPFNAPTIAAAVSADPSIKAIYLSAVTNPEGYIYSKDDLQQIANFIATHNAAHPEHMITVVSDEVYRHSEWDASRPTHSFASFCGIDAASGTSIPMHQHTVTIASLSKSFANGSARIGFATTGNTALRERMKEFLSFRSSGDINPSLEMLAAATLALTPRQWIEENNRYYQRQLNHFMEHVDELNTELGGNVVEAIQPHGGWFATLKFPKSSLPDSLQTSDAMMAYLMFYGLQPDGSIAANTGLNSLPGSLFGYEDRRLAPQEHVYIRLSLSCDHETAHEIFHRLEDALSGIPQLSTARMKQIAEASQRWANGVPMASLLEEQRATTTELETHCGNTNSPLQTTAIITAMAA